MAAATAAAQAGQLMSTLSTAWAVRADPQLQSVLRTVAGAEAGGPFAVGQPGRQPWLRVEGGNVAALRERPEGLPFADMAALLDAGGLVAETLRSALARTSVSAEASELIGSLYAPELPDRRTMRTALEWAPALEQGAYAAGAALCASLDELRPQVLAAVVAAERPSDSRILSYWWQTHALANLTLVAADQRAQPWLADMAYHFEWTNWTPTFPLVRERSVWLAACAARSAAAFGERVAARYLAVLETTNDPFKVFDSLFGLVAIGIARSAAAQTILAEMRLRRRALDGRPLAYGEIVRLAYDDAIATLAGDRVHEQRAVLEFAGIKWRPNSPHGLATRKALRQDPARYSTDGHFLGFAMLPTVLETPLDKFHPEADTRKSLRQLTMLDAVEVVRRAWVPPDAVSETIH
jgi:hypothetical protein